VKNELWGREIWVDGCYVGTVGKEIIAEVTKNILRNEE
jgi:hypothetical protein